MKKIMLSIGLMMLLGIPGISQTKNITARLTSESLEEVQVIRGMPVIVHFRIFNNLGFSYEEAVWGIPDSLLQDPELIRRLDSVFAPIPISQPGTPWYGNYILQFKQGISVLNNSDLHIIKPLPSDTHLLDYQDPSHLYLGIDPGTTRQWKTGKMQFRIGIALAGISDTVWSNTLTLNALQQKIKSDKKYSVEQQFRVAHYWLLRGECNKAKSLAGQLYATDTASMGNTMLMAMVAECDDQTETALHYYYKAYEQYMQQPQKGYEPPDLLMMKIGELQEKFYLREP